MTLFHSGYLPDLKANVAVYRHNQSGAEVTAVLNDEEFRRLTFAFRTPPVNNGGGSHILEHMLLRHCSKFAEQKDLFAALLRGTFNYDYNGGTHPGITEYPVGTTDIREFMKFLEIMGEALLCTPLHPADLAEEICSARQSKHGTTKFAGILYKEMSGIAFDMDSVTPNALNSVLMAGTPYQFDAGGKPSAIRRIQFAELLELKEQWYQASNARVFLYGDVPLEKCLKNLSALFTRAHNAADRKIAVPAGFDHNLLPKFHNCPLVQTEFPMQHGHQFTSLFSELAIAWILPIPKDRRSEHIAGLAKSIISGFEDGFPIHDAISRSGFSADLRQLPDDGMPLSLSGLICGGITPKQAQEIRLIVLKAMKQLAEKGVNPALVKKLLHERRRDYCKSLLSEDRGEDLFAEVLEDWVCNRSALLNFGSDLDTINSLCSSYDKVAKEISQIFREMLASPHGVAVLNIPSHSAWKSEQATLANHAGLAKRNFAGLSLQQSEDRPLNSAVSIEGWLTTEDMDRRQGHVMSRLEDGKIAYRSCGLDDSMGTQPVLLDLAFTLDGLGPEKLFHAGLLAEMMGDLTSLSLKPSRQSHSHSINHTSHEIDSSIFSGRNVRSGNLLAYSMLRFSADAGGIEDALAAAESLPAKSLKSYPECTPNTLKRIKREITRDLLDPFEQEEKASSRALANISSTGLLEDALHGIGFYRNLLRLGPITDKKAERAWEGISEVAAFALTSERLIANLTATKRGIDEVLPIVRRAHDLFPSGPKPLSGLNLKHPALKDEGIIVPTATAGIASAFNLSDSGYSYHGSALVACHYLKTAFFWEQVRAGINCYGVDANFDIDSNSLIFSSTANPDVASTFDVFLQTARHLQRMNLSHKHLERLKVATLANRDSPDSFDEIHDMGLDLTLTQYSRNRGQRTRDQIFDTRLADLRHLGLCLEVAVKNQRSSTVVIGNNRLIQEWKSVRRSDYGLEIWSPFQQLAGRRW